MKKLVLSLLVLLAPVQALAEARYTSTKLSCSEVRGIIREDGSVFLRWTSKRVPGLPRYDRFVRDSYQCPSYEYAAATTVPTADDPECWVKNCQTRVNDDDFFRRRH